MRTLSGLCPGLLEQGAATPFAGGCNREGRINPITLNPALADLTLGADLQPSGAPDRDRGHGGFCNWRVGETPRHAVSSPAIDYTAPSSG
ncbi:hypothetical protein NDU88_002120 [Pleurodeles waltl]|uniref:Uncharacterized protein n=1 Tax=Pleurodeles waltl TaxID=8319 RepID=A0AAV7T175_PLEWA|nr:hypothetical protein NDU88_002120 [Pleurodeles waltl]